MAGEIFSSSVQKLITQNLAIEELCEAGERLRAAGEADLGIRLYKFWIQLNPSDPLLYAACFNYSLFLSNAGDLAGAKEALEQVISLNPDFYPAHINLGGLYERLGFANAAVGLWMAMVDRLGAVSRGAVKHKAIALKQVGRVLEGNGMLAEAERALRQSLDMENDQLDAAQHYISLRQVQCEWPIVVPWERMGKEALIKGISPLTMAAYSDDPMLHLASAWYYNKNMIGYSYTDFQKNHQVARAYARPGRRRIGYVSSDLRGHAVGFVMAELFELHNRDEFEIFVYYCGIQVPDSIQVRIRTAVEHWIDINNMDDVTVARQIIDDGIDILVDLNGYTKGAREKVFALRPAPVIVNWLGYPGTMGSPYHHYIVADDWIIPKSSEIYYSEKVLRLPCYQPNDRKRAVAPSSLTRQDVGLPENATVFCCFNSVHKISRFTFDRWIAILQRVPESVLWLFSGPEVANQRLRDYAERHGIAPERLVFAGRLSNAEHIARYPLADLFLDTSPYGAHVTASDALWMGVPILTVSGRGFAARVTGSLCRAAGLPELVCSTSQEFIERGIELGMDRSKIQRLKERLVANHDTCILFDIKSLTQKLEGLYKQMWQEFRDGHQPRPDLTNLDTYLEVASEEDHETVEMLTVVDYEARYKAKFTRRHRYCSIGEDRRLWMAADIAKAELDFDWALKGDGDAGADADLPELRVSGLR